MHPCCELVSVADTDAENLAFASAAFDVPGYATWDAMFAAQAIDIAMAVLPVAANAAAVIASAEAGVKAVFCEKPLTASLRDADDMIDACRSRGIPLAAGVVISSHRDYLSAFERAAAGEIGEILRIHLYDGNGQGGCHGLNLARKFAGKAAVESVIGWVAGDADSDFEEPYETGGTGFGEIGGIIRFANGIECFSNWQSLPWRGIEVVGTKGMICNRNNTALGLKLFHTDGPAAHDPTQVTGLFEQGPWPAAGYDSDGWRDAGEPMHGIVQALVDALAEDQPLQVTSGDDLRHALEIAIALRESARRGSALVDLPLADRDLLLYPEKDRWTYKKQIHGADWYAEQLQATRRT
jgi:predicted dehydrogenase